MSVPVRALLGWLLVLAAATALMATVRADLDKAHAVLLFLLIVLAGSAVSGRTVGITLAGLAFLAFDWFLLPPYNTLYLQNRLDWLILIAFLATGIVAAQLFHRAQEEARIARERSAEVDRLAAIGAETLSVGSAEAALRAVSDVIRASTGASACVIHLAAESGGDSLVDWVVQTRSGAARQRDGTIHLHSARPTDAERRALESGSVLALLLPLTVRERVVGVLRVASDEGLAMDAARWRFLNAISYYAALAVERVRLVAEADRAEALRETNRLKDALLASVSHDLRTPLTTIKALAHDLSALGDERSEIIELEADRLNRMVADLLDLSQLNAGALMVRQELNAVDDLLGALSQRVEPQVGRDRLRIVLPHDQPFLVGRFDLVHAVRILTNLVENAAKYSTARDLITVVASRVGSQLLVRVEDRGPGISSADAMLIFEPFYRSDTVPLDARGAGLGLAIARRLAEAQGGSLDYEPREGGGSVFTLRLPATDETS